MNYQTMKIDDLKTRWENVADMIERLGNSNAFCFSEGIAQDRSRMIADLKAMTRVIFERCGTLAK